MHKLFLLAMTTPILFAQYAVHRDGEIVQLEDTKNQVTFSVVPSIGNRGFELKVKGQNVLYFPAGTVEQFRKQPGLSGIPFLGPWANRLDETAFYANGKKYSFNMDLGNVRGPLPIHGFLSTAPWQVLEAKADARSAWVTSRLEVYRQPEWMAQFPFAHTVEMTYRLQDGVLEVHTKLENLSSEPMPVSIGYHPYFQLTDSTRDEWTVSLAARSEWLLAANKIPTGETRPIEQFLGDPKAFALKDFNLDHVFYDLIRDSSGRATMSVKGKAQRLDVMFGPKFQAAVVFAPKPNANNPNPAAQRGFICFEPMAGVTDAMNLAQKGLYKDLQMLPPGQTWQESFWIRASGF